VLYHDQQAMFQKLSNALMAADPGDSDDVRKKKYACTEFGIFSKYI
jgi:hypothetical protein